MEDKTVCENCEGTGEIFVESMVIGGELIPAHEVKCMCQQLEKYEQENDDQEI